MAISKGVYSLYNGWLQKPEKQDIPEPPDISVEYNEWVNKANSCETIEDIDNFLDDLYKLRQNGLLKDGEFGTGNLVFKELRNNNVIQDLKDKKVELENKEMSLGEQLEEDLIDMDIYNQLTPEQQAYIDKWDLFLKQENGKIICATFEDEQEYDTIEELQNDLDYSIAETEKLGLDEAIIEEASEEDIRAKALADYLDESVEAIEAEGDNYYSLPAGETYLVLTEDEAYEAAKESIESIYDDIGLQSFSADFQDYILRNCIDADAIDIFIDDEIDYYANQEQDEDTVNYLNNLDTYEAIDYIKDLLGEDEFAKWAKENGAIDIDAVVDECISEDGIAHFIAGYDGEEIDLGNGLYAYRLD